MNNNKDIQNDKYVTPGYLLSHGFIQYKDETDGGIFEIPVEIEEGSIHFREIIFDRRMCVVTFTPRLAHDGFDYSVYFQDDAGCGFILIPFCWWDLPIEYFESVYYGIRGEKPKFNPKSFQDADFEVIYPKQITDKQE